MTFLPSRRTSGTLCLVACFIGTAGCGNGLARVQGKVTLDGQSINRGMISFEPSDGKGPDAGGNVENGKYRVENVIPGPKTVRIWAVKVVGEKPLDAGIPNSPMVEVTQEIIPDRYNNQTELKLNITPPATSHDFELKSS